MIAHIYSVTGLHGLQQHETSLSQGGYDAVIVPVRTYTDPSEPQLLEAALNNPMKVRNIGHRTDYRDKPSTPYIPINMTNGHIEYCLPAGQEIPDPSTMTPDCHVHVATQLRPLALDDGLKVILDMQPSLRKLALNRPLGLRIALATETILDPELILDRPLEYKARELSVELHNLTSSINEAQSAVANLRVWKAYVTYRRAVSYAEKSVTVARRLKEKGLGKIAIIQLASIANSITDKVEAGLVRGLENNGIRGQSVSHTSPNYGPAQLPSIRALDIIASPLCEIKR